MIKQAGVNGYNETHWTLHVPDEHCQPGLEVGIICVEKGIRIGGDLIPWGQIDEARSRVAPSPAAKLVGVPVEFIEHVKHARKELCRLEQSPLHVRQKLAQKLTDWIAMLATDTAQQQGKAE